MKAITVKQPWAWAITHGGKEAKWTPEGIGPCPVSECLDTLPRKMRMASVACAAGVIRPRPSDPVARLMPRILLKRENSATPCVGTAAKPKIRNACQRPSQVSVRTARPHEHERGRKQTRTSGNAIAESHGLRASTASHRRCTTASLPSKGECAPSAGPHRMTRAATGCTSITVTRPGSSEASSAVLATGASETSATIRTGARRRRLTYDGKGSSNGGAR